MFLKSTKGKVATKKLTLERLFNKGVIGLGVILGIVGALVTVLSSFYPHLLK